MFLDTYDDFNFMVILIFIYIGFFALIFMFISNIKYRNRNNSVSSTIPNTTAYSVPVTTYNNPIIQTQTQTQTQFIPPYKTTNFF